MAEIASGNRLSFGGGVSMDFAFPTKNFRAWGGFIGYKGVFNHAGDYGVNHVQLGVLTAGTMFQYKRAPLLGLGVDIRIPVEVRGVHYYNTDNTLGCEEIEGGGLVLRAGIISQKHLYCYADLALGVYQRDWFNVYHDSDGHKQDAFKESQYNMYFNFGLNLGFKF